MKKLFLLMVLSYSYYANATFSIIAYDEEEYGVAFASCAMLSDNFDSVEYLSRVVPNNGGVVTREKSFPLTILFYSAEGMIEADVCGGQIIGYLIENDPENKPEERQYLLLNSASNKLQYSS
ncbi:hypothetical protein [Psychromonas aquimarina]|uniref:hypothetical protein n=1 Tax=Psychromonas aquimarina TaxID=444919 RepID=UPI00048F4798|nr:hypothetical protein [Psychromonas aquimarina]